MGEHASGAFPLSSTIYHRENSPGAFNVMKRVGQDRVSNMQRDEPVETL